MSYISSHAGTAIDDAIDLVEIIFNKIYPVGAIYMSADSTNPSALFGGTWEQIIDKVLMCAGSSYAAGTSGGTATHTHTSAAHIHTTAGHTLTVSEMPSHNHNVKMPPYLYAQVSTGNSAIAPNTSGAVAVYTYSTTNTGGGGSHSHGDTGSTTPGDTGSSSNLPPYLTVYCWKRIA